MEMDYKEDIVKTRVGHLGSSDAKLIQQVASMGYVPKTAHKRLAVCKGLIEQDNITTRAMLFGDYIENSIFTMLKQTDERWESNPLWVSEKYVKKNVSLLAHPDFVLVDEEKHLIKIFECKATKSSFAATRDHYNAQLYIEATLGREIAAEKGKAWRVQISLCHYNTEGLDLEQPFEFDENRLTVKQIRVQSAFDIDKGLSIIDAFLEKFDMYAPDDEIESTYLPAKIKHEFDAMALLLAEINQKKQMLDDFKAKMLPFMETKGIKSIKSETWSITRVEPTVKVSFDYKRYLADYAKKHPQKAKKIRSEYEKRTTSSGYVKITTKEEKNTDN